jgi:hypothetical protein
MSYPSFGYGNGCREYGSLTNGAVFTPYPSDLTVTVEPVGVVVDGFGVEAAFHHQNGFQELRVHLVKLGRACNALV